jgi:hypothetical protein
LKPLSPAEIIVLSGMQGKDAFSPEELKDLQNGAAAFAVYNRAERILRAEKAFLNAFIPRAEAQATFSTKMMHADLNNHVFVLKRLLFKKGIITDAELVTSQHEALAETWPNLCAFCSQEFVTCEGGMDKKPLRFAGEVYADLTDPLADKVVECGHFTAKAEIKANTAEEGNA